MLCHEDNLFDALFSRVTTLAHAVTIESYTASTVCSKKKRLFITANTSTVNIPTIDQMFDKSINIVTIVNLNFPLIVCKHV